MLIPYKCINYNGYYRIKCKKKKKNSRLIYELSISYFIE